MTARRSHAGYTILEVLMAMGIFLVLIVPLALWRRRREDLIERGGRLGVRLAPDEGPEAIAGDLSHFDLVAVNFPVFTDGRGYSTSRLLRSMTFRCPRVMGSNVPV